jgi:guanine deaminase
VFRITELYPTRVGYGEAEFAPKRGMTNSFLKQAIELAVENVRRDGGPFAALVVKDGIVIAAGANQVTRANDPTAHAEVVAIREACRVLGDFQLAGCDVYTSCEPCPMCLGALYWARPSRVFFAATHDDAAAAGFDDSFIYRQIQVPHSQRSIPMVHVVDEQATRPFQEWVNRPNKTAY